MVSRVEKVIAGRDPAERRRPRDGWARVMVADGRAVDRPVSRLLTIARENLDCRLPDRFAGRLRPDRPCFCVDASARLQGLLVRGHGRPLVAGPTACGKTTTGRTTLPAVSERRFQVLTFPDPLEDRIAGIAKTQVDRAARFVFASALRKVLPHDADAIVVGEIRDRETAALAVASALTGRLVLPNLHPNTVASALTGLLDPRVGPFMVRATKRRNRPAVIRLDGPYDLAPEPVPQRMRRGFGLSAEEGFSRARGCRARDGLGRVGARRSTRCSRSPQPSARRFSAERMPTASSLRHAEEGHPWWARARPFRSHRVGRGLARSPQVRSAPVPKSDDLRAAAMLACGLRQRMERSHAT